MVIYEYLTQQEISLEEKRNLANAFKALDTNGNGTLTKEEVMAAYNRYSSLHEWEISEML